MLDLKKIGLFLLYFIDFTLKGIVTIFVFAFFLRSLAFPHIFKPN